MNGRATRKRGCVLGALHHPQFVGCHWFQYQDEPLTARGDGENMQIGFIDVCDMSYVETIAACPEVAAALYQRQLI